MVEAEKCLTVGAPNACGVMARRAMHSLCHDKKAEGKDLYDKLKALCDAHQITPDLYEWAQRVQKGEQRWIQEYGDFGSKPDWKTGGGLGGVDVTRRGCVP
jgi:hypothetical protein